MGTTDPPLYLGALPGAALARPSVVVRSSSRCLSHRPPPGHPESPARLESILEALREPTDGMWSLEEDATLPADDEIVGTLKWIHAAEYIQRVEDASRRGSGHVDTEDCCVSEGSFDAALAAAGLSLGAALDLVNGRLSRVFLASRPPAHHAERERARGYCFFNHVALAAEVITRAWATPVLVVDFDAHHGNGLQEHFYRRGDVGYVSVHAFPGFPGSGTADEVGEGPGMGLTRNVPLAAGSGDAEVVAALEAAVDEVGSLLRPAAIVVAAGFSGHVDDPVGDLQMTASGYAAVTRVITEASVAWSGGRILSVLEGGFAPAATAECARVHVRELAGVGWAY